MLGKITEFTHLFLSSKFVMMIVSKKPLIRRGALGVRVWKGSRRVEYVTTVAWRHERQKHVFVERCKIVARTYTSMLK